MTLRIPKENVDDFAEMIEFAREWDYVEREGKDCRFDWGNGEKSFWIRSDGVIEGEIPGQVKIQIEEAMRELGDC